MSTTVFGPYSPVRKAGNFYYISGQVGIDPQTKEAAASLEAQTKQLFANLKTLLDQHSLAFDDVIKTTIFLKNIDDFPAINELYVTHFNEPRPARSCVEVSCLPKIAVNNTELLVELEAVAYKEQS